VHIRAKTKPFRLKELFYRTPIQDCVEGTKKGYHFFVVAALKVPKNTVTSIILKWEKLGTTKIVPRAGRPAKLSNRGRKALVREVTKNPMITLTELHRSSVEMVEAFRRTNLYAALHQSGLYSRVARLKPEVKGT
jgi:hypothetical protein